MTDSTRPHDLRVNHLRAPLGVGDDPLRVSWKLPGQAAVQHAYRIVADAWDTGRVESAESLFVPVDVPPRSGRRVEWRVKTWTDVGESDWSETELVGARAPRRRGLDAPGGSRRVESDDLPLRQRPAYQLGGTVRIEGEVHRARLYATAHGVYEAFVNGAPGRRHRAHAGMDRVPHPTSTCRPTTSPTSLVPGDNVIGALLSDGWWRGQNSVSRRVDDYGTTTALLLQLVVALASGETIVFGTDDTWRSTASHVLGADLIAGEVHDLRRGTGWDAWLGWDARPGRGPRLRRARRVDRRRRCGGSRSCGRRRCGRSRPVGGSSTSARTSTAGSGCATSAPRAPTITLTYGEWLDEDGDVTQEHVSSPAVDRGRTGGDVPGRHGDLGWRSTPRCSSPGTAPRGSSTSASTGYDGPLTADDITAVVVHTDLDAPWLLRLLRRPHQRVAPHRRVELPRQRLRHPDRLPHPGAGRMDRRLADLRRDRGVPLRRRRLLREVAPRPRRRAATRRQGDQPRPGVPSRRRPATRALAADRRLRRVGRRRRARALDHLSDDRRPAGPRRPVVVDAGVGGLRRATRPPPAGTRHAVDRSAEPAPHEQFIWDSGWHFGEWLEAGESLDDTIAAAMVADHGPVATAYLHRSAQQLVGHRRGSSAATTTPSATASSPRHVADAWRTEFLADDGTTTPDTQATYARALALRPRPRRPACRVGGAARRAASATPAPTSRTGFLATPFLLPVLADTGHLDVAYDLLFQDTEPSWLVMVDRGATTVWEEWGGIDADGRPHASLNHYSKGAVITFLHQYVAGLQLLEPGYRRFRVAPRPGGGLTWARGPPRQPVRTDRGPLGAARRTRSSCRSPSRRARPPRCSCPPASP